MIEIRDRFKLMMRFGGAAFGVCLLLLAFARPALGQAEDAEAPEEEAAAQAEDAEALAESDAPPVDLESIAALEYSTYDTGWVRYSNGTHVDHPILRVEGVSQFPFRTVSLPGRIDMRLLGDLDFVGALIDEYDLHYDEAGLQGICDTERMRRYQSTDTLCVPGTSIMAPGLIITVVYHPETNAIVALTTTIDNIGGYATRADEWKHLRQQAAEAEQATDATTCGPWNAGRWITAEEYQNSGLSLPINTDRLLGGITHYECSVPENGAPFLIAWTVMEGGGSSSSAGDSGGSGGGGGGGGSTGGGDGGGSGEPNCGPPDPDPRCITDF